MSDIIKTVYMTNCAVCGKGTISQFEADFMSKREFLEDIGRAGWIITPRGPMCPQHAEEYKKAVEEAKKKQEEAAKLKQAADEAAAKQAEQGEESIEPVEAPQE